MTEEVTAKLMESAYHQIERDGILATRLCTHKDDVELTNENKLQQLPGVISDYCLKYMLHDRSQVGIGGKKIFSRFELSVAPLEPNSSREVVSVSAGLRLFVSLLFPVLVYF